MNEFGFHPEALADLDEIWEWIAVDSVRAADSVIAEIIEAISKVADVPDQGHRRPDLTSRPVRFLLVREYLIAYAPEERPLWVVAVIHGRRSPRVMAAMLRGRDPISE